jgi:hypothetical protein
MGTQSVGTKTEHYGKSITPVYMVNKWSYLKSEYAEIIDGCNEQVGRRTRAFNV